MEDQYSRKINYLRLSLTQRCNFRCLYCHAGRNGCSAPDELSLREIAVIAQAASEIGCTAIRLTGGEPLVRRDISEICETVRAVANPQKLGITTNGFFLGRLAGSLYDAGVTHVNVSLDTADEAVFEKITGIDGFRTVLDGIGKAVATGFKRVKINAVLLHGVNDSEEAVRRLAELTERLPVDLRFIELMPFGLTGSDYLKSFVSKELVFRALPNLEKIPDYGEGPAVMYHRQGSPGNIGIISPMTSCFCKSCNRIRVLSDGRVRPCLLGSREFGIRGLGVKDTADVLRRAIASKPASYRDGSDNLRINCEMKRIGG